jgi:hypothetical protein
MPQLIEAPRRSHVVVMADLGDCGLVCDSPVLAQLRSAVSDAADLAADMRHRMTNQLQVVASAARIEARKPEASAQSVAAAVEAQVKFIALQNDGLPYPLGA